MGNIYKGKKYDYSEKDRKRAKLWYENNTERKKKYDKEYVIKYSEKRKKVKKEWNEKNPDKLKEINKRGRIKYQYKITFEEYNNLLIECNNICPICKIELVKPFIDHDHKTGKVRGILCHYCNTGIGYMRDSINNLTNAIKYLEKHYNITSTT